MAATSALRAGMAPRFHTHRCEPRMCVPRMCVLSAITLEHFTDLCHLEPARDHADFAVLACQVLRQGKPQHLGTIAQAEELALSKEEHNTSQERLADTRRALAAQAERLRALTVRSPSAPAPLPHCPISKSCNPTIWSYMALSLQKACCFAVFAINTQIALHEHRDIRGYLQIKAVLRGWLAEADSHASYQVVSLYVCTSADINNKERGLPHMSR